MCGGLVSESLVRILATEEINLPTTVVQRGIDSCVLRTDEARVRIDTPLHEMRIAASLTAAFQKHYLPTYRSIADDSLFGKRRLFVVHQIKAARPLVRGVLRMVAREQTEPGAIRRMNIVLRDMFTGSAPYQDVFCWTGPRFLGQFM